MGGVNVGVSGGAKGGETHLLGSKCADPEMAREASAPMRRMMRGRSIIVCRWRITGTWQKDEKDTSMNDIPTRARAYETVSDASVCIA